MRWLESNRLTLYRLLRIAGVVEDTSIQRNGTTQVQRTVAWSTLVDLFSDPAGTLQQQYAWGTDGWEHDRLLEELRLLCAGKQRPARRAPLRDLFLDSSPPLVERSNPALGSIRELVVPVAHGDLGKAFGELGIVVVPAPEDPAGPVTGLYVANLATGSAHAAVDVTNGWHVDASGTADATGAVGIHIDPTGVKAQGFEPAAHARIALVHAGSPQVLAGAPDGLRVELRGGQLAATLISAPAELVIEASGTTPSGPALVVVFDPGDTDALIQTLLGSSPLEAAFGLSAAWSSRSGVSIDGSPAAEIPLNLTLGPVEILSLEIDAGVGDDALSAAALLTFSAGLGPFAVAIEGLGLSARTAPASDGTAARFGDLALGLEFVPPTGLGLALDAGVAAGGGFVSHDSATGSYTGVLEVELLTIGASAVGLVNTRLPDGDWSMFLALFIDVPGIPLGFGFTLDGLGGLAGVNRALNVPALEDTIRSTGLDAILFPEDPVADAPQIVDQLEGLFPVAPDRYVFGPMVQIGWGTPALITAELGVVISLPDPITIAVVGRIASVLPTDDLALVVLNLDVDGVVETATATLSIDASLHDSYIAEYALDGDMALRASFGRSPTFLLALGGFHPGFRPPPGFPALDRLSLSIGADDVLDVRFECYFAIASNSLQFGAALELTAEVDGFGINGGASFDTLIKLSPFQLIVHVGCYVTVTGAGIDLAGVWFDGRLSGPNPWHVTGTATFKLLGLDVPLDLDVAIGTALPEPPPPADDVLGMLRIVLADRDAWSAIDGGGGGVVLAASDATSDELVIAPDGTLGVAQRIVPLRVTIDRADPFTIAGGWDWFDLDVGETAPPGTGELLDWFPPSSYADLDPMEALTAPSFEQLRAGITVGGGDPTSGPGRAVTLEYEQIIRDPAVAGGPPPHRHDLASDPRAAAIQAAATPGMAPSRAAAAYVAHSDQGTLGVLAPGYVARDRLDGAVLARAPTWLDCRLTPAGRDPAAVVSPAWEVAGT